MVEAGADEPRLRRGEGMAEAGADEPRLRRGGGTAESCTGADEARCRRRRSRPTGPGDA